MVRSRGKSPSATPATVAPMSTPLAESFMRKKLSALRRGEIKALVVSSIAVASSIGSPSLNQCNHICSEEQKTTHISHTAQDTVGREADLAWRTAYATAKMIIDVAQGSSDAFLPLSAVVGALSVLIRNYDQTVRNGEQIEEIEKRVLSLSDILRSPLREDDRSERARRELLCRRMVGVLEKLEPLVKQNGLLKFLRNGDHSGLLNGFVQDIAHAVTDYQTSIQQGTYENTGAIREAVKNIDKTTKGIAESAGDISHKAREITEAADLDLLDKLNPIRNAGHRAEHHDRCLAGTRESILRDILHWAQSTHDQPVFWLNGLAGTGKSTIAQTFAEMANNHDILGASFFCSRDYLDRKELKNIFPTLAYQLACRYPRFRNHLVNVIKQDPSVAHNSLISQLRDLLVDPLSATDISCVIVIDALDECIDDQPASAILSVLGRLVSKLPMVKFFITGRPEPRIRSGFRLPLLEPFTQIFLLHEVDPTSIGGDIRLYLTEKLNAIARHRSGIDLPEAWPSDEDITALVKKSSGLFIFASTVVKFVESEHHEPTERLRLISSKANDTSHEGASGIDSLYSQVLYDAFSGINGKYVFVDLKRILSAVVLALNPLSRDELAQLLNIDSTVISTRLRHLHSVILVPSDGSEEIRVFHKSFPDFLQDLERCHDSRFRIDSPARHGDMALSCLDLVRKLKMNPCGLPPFVMNRDIADRQRLLRDKLGGGLRYACKYWSTHLLFSPSPEIYGNRLATSTSLFFDHGVFPWMEVMSLEGCLEDVIYSMNNLLVRVDIVDGSLRRLTTDCLRFTLHFFRPIQVSAQHIYHTALPLSPETSALRLRFFKSRPLWEKDWTTHQVSSSRTPTSWGPILRTITADSGNFKHVAVAGQRIIAVCEDSHTVNVYDAVTGVLKSSLDASQKVVKAEGTPDGSLLFFAHHPLCEITVWDTQTGGLICTLATTFEISDIAVSLKGKYLASCSSDGDFKFWEVESGRGDYHFLEEPIDHRMCWLEPEDQVALALQGAVVILEVTTRRRLYTIPVAGDVRGIAFNDLPLMCSTNERHLAISLAYGIDNVVVIVCIQESLSEESTPPLNDISCLAFSGDGGRIICATTTGDLRSYRSTFPSHWDNHLSYLGTVQSMSLLGSGQLVVNSGGSIQLLEVDYDRPSRASPNSEIAHVYQLDSGKAIGGSSGDKELVNLLDTETMKTLARYHLDIDEHGAPFKPRFVCASIDRRIAILCVRTLDGFALKLFDIKYDIDCTILVWEKPLLQPVLLGALSLDGKTVITVSGGGGPNGDGNWEIRVRQALDGKNLTPFLFTRKGRPPSSIAFTSETQFYTEDLRVFSAPPLDEDESDYEGDFQDEDNCEEYHRWPQSSSTPFTAPECPPLYPRKPGITTRTWPIPKPTIPEQPKTRKIVAPTSVTPGPEEPTITTTNPDDQSRTRTRSEKRLVRKNFSLKTVGSHFGIGEVPGEETIPVCPPYTLDEGLEWVVDAKSRRVCWLPPGYISGIESGHYFVGSSLVMAGRDGIVRRLTFRNPRPDS